MNTPASVTLLATRRKKAVPDSARCEAIVDYTRFDSGRCLKRRLPDDHLCWRHRRQLNALIAMVTP